MAHKKWIIGTVAAVAAVGVLGAVAWAAPAIRPSPGTLVAAAA